MHRLHPKEVEPGLGESASLVQGKDAYLATDGHPARVQAQDSQRLYSSNTSLAEGTSLGLRSKPSPVYASKLSVVLG